MGCGCKKKKNLISKPKSAPKRPPVAPKPKPKSK